MPRRYLPSIERAEARIRGMQARVEAIDQLISVGALDDALAPEGDDIDRELAHLTREAAVENDLQRLKAEVTAVQPVQP